MKFVLLCDANYLKGDIATFAANFPTEHTLSVMTSEEFLLAKSFPEETFAILTERFTWQKSFSLFRYFGLLPILEVLPLGIVGRPPRKPANIGFSAVSDDSRKGALKGRSMMRNQEFYFNPSSAPEEISSLLSKFIAAPPQSFTFPRGASKV